MLKYLNSHKQIRALAKFFKKVILKDYLNSNIKGLPILKLDIEKIYVKR